MFILYTVVIVGIGVIALVGTLIAGKQVNQTMNDMEKVAPENQEQKARAHHFKNEKKNLSVLVWIYVITFIVAILAAAIYMAVR